MRNATRLAIVILVVVMMVGPRWASAQVRSGLGPRQGGAPGGPRAGVTPPPGVVSPAVPAPGRGPAQKPPINPATLVPPLEQAYETLSSADRDYGGHRVAAMKDIAVAVSLLGTTISGNGTGHEPQSLSNLQITSVQMSLQSVGRSVPAGQHHVEIVNRINSAINQLTLAMQAESTHPPVAGKPTTAPSTTQPIGIAVGPAGGPIEDNGIEVAALDQVYQVLVPANHNYQGHRVAAMNAIKRAITALGGTISGDGGGRENQAVSDAQLQQAVYLLGQVRDSFAADDPKKVLNDLTAAVNQLTMALSIN